MPKKILAIVAVLLLIGGAILWTARHGSKPVVAIVDTGFDPASPALRGHVGAGLNTLVAGGDTTDREGHGTAIAERILKVAGTDATLLPIKVTEKGSATRAADLVAAVRFALAHQARIIHFSLGITQGSPELTAALQDATRAGALIVAAAGAGIPNPFKPMAVSALQPQAYAGAIVVAATESTERPDLLSNTGPEIDVSTVPVPDSRLGSSSSAAAAEVTGALVRWLSQGSLPAEPARIRATLRAWSKPFRPGGWTEDRVIEMVAKSGFGLLDPTSAPGTKPAPLVARALKIEPSGALIVEASVADPIEKAAAEWKCGGGTGGTPATVTNIAGFGKGRASLRLVAPPAPHCAAEVSVRTLSGETFSAQP